MLCFENNLGCLQLSGGNGLWNLTDYEGMGLPDKSFQVISYAGMPGQLTLSERAEARVITLRGDCCGGRQELSRGMRILNQRGCLTVSGQDTVRRIDAYCSHFELQKRHGGYIEFIMQFTCDDPYFTGEQAVRLALYSRQDLVSGSFQTPCLFTKRISTATVCNRGDVSAEPVFTIICHSAGTAGETRGICIENKTTGACFRLDYEAQTGETITVDIPKRQVTSNLARADNNQGNLIYCLSKDTFLSDMYLAVGENQFVTTNYSADSDILVVCQLEEKYLEAVI